MNIILCDGCSRDVTGKNVAEIEGADKQGREIKATLCMSCAAQFIEKSPAMADYISDPKPAKKRAKRGARG